MNKGFIRKLWKFPVEGQRELLLTKLEGRDIYEHGVGAETIDACIRAFRGQGGLLYIAADFRVFGSSQEEIARTVDKLELAHIGIVDLAHPEHRTIAASLRWAYARLAEWQRWGGDKKRARATGKMGAKAKAENAAAKRAETLPEPVVRKLVALIPPLTWRALADALGVSTATLRRNYLDKPIRKGRKL